MRIIEISDPRAEKSEDDIVVLVNTSTGRLRQVRCGPVEAAHHSGERLVYWNPKRACAEMPIKHEGQWRFYKAFCEDSEVARSVGLTDKESAAYYPAYVELMERLGTGDQHKHLVGMEAGTGNTSQLDRLYHPALLPMRRAFKSTNGQQRITDADMIKRITATLGSDEQRKANEKAMREALDQQPAPAPKKGKR